MRIAKCSYGDIGMEDKMTGTCTSQSRESKLKYSWKN
jgi:hypothetical protein